MICDNDEYIQVLGQKLPVDVKMVELFSKRAIRIINYSDSLFPFRRFWAIGVCMDILTLRESQNPAVSRGSVPVELILI